mgnify:CR=1 FL=1
MSNFVNLQMNILGKDIFLCVSNGSVKTSNLNCDILGLRLQCYSCLKKDSFFSGFHYISIEAITICTYLNYDLSTIENINFAVSKKADIYFRIKRLIDENQMGHLFKVMFILFLFKTNTILSDKLETIIACNVSNPSSNSIFVNLKSSEYIMYLL